MQFPDPLVRGTLIKRYKRFMADVRLEDGTAVTAHCPNSGSMLSVKEDGAEVWLSPARNPDRKLRWTWELIRVGESLVGVNTGHPNTLVAEAVADGTITELAGYASQRREVKYGKNSRIDLLLEDPDRPACYVEVKNVTMRRDLAAGPVEFPDGVTARGTKHLAELSDMVAQGHRAVMAYLVQREDWQHGFTLADDIDPDYAAALDKARAAGVEVVCYACRLTPRDIVVRDPVPLAL
ncbi:MAG: DNA/RNA nuclease SfsA [Rhodobacterales bacterium]|nr:DNA/RNA nuclease SfsA [Rhodobacterales bacterium]